MFRFNLLIVMFLFATPCLAGEWSGFIAVDGRGFFNDSQYTGQESSGFSLVAEPEYYHDFESGILFGNGKDRIVFVPFFRFDQYDDRRTHADIRELNWLHVNDGWEIRAGIGKVFWGVAESRHLVNIINQDDLVEDVDGEDKLGQPMFDFALTGSSYPGTIRFFVLPGFRERTFQGEEGRLRGSRIIATDRAQYKSSQEESHVDYAVRYSNFIDEWDFGISQFYGTSREPRLIADGNIFVPHYDVIAQTGVDVQATFDSWLWKFEGIYRSGQAKTAGGSSNYDFAATVVGLEYTFFSAFDSPADIGLLAEYLWDGRPGDAPATTQDNDIFVGSRLTLNDVQSTELLAGGSIDTNNGSLSLLAEFGRRFGDSWKLEVDARFFSNVDKNDISFETRHDDHLQVRIAKYF